MDDSPSTRPSLLLRMRNEGDTRAWSDFVELYAPLIHRYLRKQGIQDADAADLAQEVLLAVAKSIGRFEYDERLGTFRGWLLTVTRNKLRNFFVANQRHPRGTGDTDCMEMLNEHSSTDERDVWEREYEQRLFDWAAERVRGQFQPSTWQAFCLTAIEGRASQEAAQRLDMSLGAVYIAKSRVMARIKEQIEKIGER